MPLIYIHTKTHEKLKQLKLDTKLKSFDQLINEIIYFWECMP